MSYVFKKTLDVPFDETIELVTAALAERGFGVLTTIDVKATLKKKIDVDFRPYTILGACNPGFAHQALQAEPHIGAMLPCNVIVEEAENGTLVRIVDPVAMMQAGGLAGDPAMEEVGTEAGVRLRRVADALSD